MFCTKINYCMLQKIIIDCMCMNYEYHPTHRKSRMLLLFRNTKIEGQAFHLSVCLLFVSWAWHGFRALDYLFRIVITFNNRGKQEEKEKILWNSSSPWSPNSTWIWRSWGWKIQNKMLQQNTKWQNSSTTNTNWQNTYKCNKTQMQ